MTDTDENADDQEATVINDECCVGFDIDKGKRKVGFMGEAYRRGTYSSKREGDRADMKVISSPKLPSQRLIDEHNVCRIAYEPWCSCWFGARALDNKHMKVVVT